MPQLVVEHGHLIAEADAATGATMREYIWLPANDNTAGSGNNTLAEALGLAANDNTAPDLPLAVVANVNTTPTTFMVHTDHLGRPVRMTDATKTTVWAASYKPWGEVQSITGPQANNLRFPGQYFQIETNLAYNWHRHYDPVQGRYIQPDPLGLSAGTNRYAYAENSPFMVTDRDGRCPVCAAIIGGAIGGMIGALINNGWCTDAGDLLDGAIAGATIGAFVPYLIPMAIGTAPAGGLGAGAVAGAEGAALGGAGLGAAGGGLRGIGALLKHHSVPSAIIGQLPKHVARNPLIRGAKGKPNIIKVDKALHDIAHASPKGQYFPGSNYNRAFTEAIKNAGGFDRVSAQTVRDIANSLMQQFC